jgi:hypothetical protein
MEAAAVHVPAVAATITRTCISVTRSSIAIAVAAAIAVHAAVSVAVAAIPWAGSDKDAAVKPRRSIVPVGGASIGIIPVVAIAAHRSGIAVAPIDRSTYSNPHRDLSMRVGCRREQQNTKQSEIAEEAHFESPKTKPSTP